MSSVRHFERFTVDNKIVTEYNNKMDTELYLLTTGARLRHRREAARLTLAEVSRRSGVTVAHLSRIENGLTDPRLSTLHRALDAMGGDLSDVSVRPPATVQARAVLERRSAGRERIESAGLGVSDASARLDRKERTGIDVSVERSERSTT